MNLRSLTARAALAGATTALVAGGLVVATDTAANAAETTGDYTCAIPILGNQTFPLMVSVPLLPPTAPAGFPVDAGLLSYSSTITVPAAAAGPLASFGVVGGAIDDFTMDVGSLAVAAPGTYTATPAGSDGSVVMEGTGANEAFSLPAAGTYDVKLPAAFTFVPMTASGPLQIGGQAVSVPCTSDAPATLGSVTLTKQVSTMTAKAKKTATGYKVTALVSNEYTSPTGKVTTKVGSKKYSGTINSGKAVLKLPKSAKGKTLTLKYAGDSYSQPTSTKVTPK